MQKMRFILTNNECYSVCEESRYEEKKDKT